MKLDEGSIDQKLALDITPLIDIVFLLVLFFAVTTSFISPEELDELKTDVVDLGEDKTRLSGKLTSLQGEYAQAVVENKAEIKGLLANINTEKGRTEKLQWMVSSLEKDKDIIEKTLGDTKSKNDSLETQLNQAFEDYKLLNVRVKGMTDDAAREAAKKALLETLLRDKSEQFAAAQADNSQLSSDLTLSRENAASLQHLLSEKAAAFAAEQEAKLGLEGKNAGLATQLTLSNESAVALRALLKKNEQQLAEQAKKHTELDDEFRLTNQSVAALTADLTSLQEQNDKQANQERMLQALLAERAAQSSSLADQLTLATTKANETKAELRSLEMSHADTSAGADRLQVTVLRLQDELAKFRELADLDAAQIDRILKAQQSLQAGLGTYLENNQLGIKRDQQRLTLQLSDKILFASGRANLKSDGLAVLRSVGKILKSRISELDIQISGHTDNIPIAGRSGILGSNWGLSAARAVNVVRFFEAELNLDADRLSAVGYGEFRPISSNDTADGRALNRRIEIVLVPRS